MKTFADIRNMQLEELQEELLNLRKEQFNLRILKSQHELTKTDQFKKIRKLIAQIKTLMTQKIGKSDVYK